MVKGETKVQPALTPPQHSDDSKITLQGKQVDVNGVKIRFHRYMDLVTMSQRLLLTSRKLDRTICVPGMSINFDIKWTLTNPSI